MSLHGSEGEQALQHRLGTAQRARAFYNQQVLDHLNPTMQAFVAHQQFMWIATADARGDCDCSLRSGPPGFVRVLNATTCAYPEYRGNGVMASLGNILENPHIGLMFVDFFESQVGLHVNGRARIVDGAVLPGLTGMVARVDDNDPPCAEAISGQWVVIDVVEAYIHCSKHIPRLIRPDVPALPAARASGDFFHARCSPRLAGSVNAPPDAAM